MNKKYYISLITMLLLTSCDNNSSSLDNSNDLDDSSSIVETSSSEHSSSSEITSSSTSSSSSSEIMSSESSSSISTSDSSSSSSQESKIVVSFNTLGGPSYKSKEYVDSPLTLPTPIYYHHDFLGWYDNENFTGDAVNLNNFIPTSSITLYAKWDEVNYLYMYYGTSTDHVRVSFHEGDELDLSTYYTPSDLIIQGITFPFVSWVYEGSETICDDVLIGGNKDIFISAKYDLTNFPRNEYMKKVSEGVYETTSTRLVHVFADGKTSAKGYISLDITATKGQSGGVGIINHASLANMDYAYEAGCKYLSSVIVPASGALQISYVDSSWKAITTIAITTLPKAYQEKFNNTSNECEFTVNMSCLSFENSFAIYLDGELAYQCNDIKTQTGIDYKDSTGLGIRSSSKGVVISNVVSNATSKNILIDTGEEVIPYETFGEPTPNISMKNYGISGLAFDEAQTDLYDPSKLNRIVDGMTMYATKKLYSSSSLTSLGNNTYKTTGNVACLIGTTELDKYQIDMNLKVAKGINGGIGIIVGAEFTSENTFEANANYIMCQLAYNGTIQFATNSGAGSFAHITGEGFEGSKALNDMPSSFKNAFIAANNEDLVPVKITVKYSKGEYVKIYIDDQYMCCCTNTELLTKYTSSGYGIRVNNSQVGSEFTYVISALEEE